MKADLKTENIFYQKVFFVKPLKNKFPDIEMKTKKNLCWTGYVCAVWLSHLPKLWCFLSWAFLKKNKNIPYRLNDRMCVITSVVWLLGKDRMWNYDVSWSHSPSAALINWLLIIWWDCNVKDMKILMLIEIVHNVKHDTVQSEIFLNQYWRWRKEFMQRDFLDQVFQKVPPNAFLAEKVMAGVDHPIF